MVIFILLFQLPPNTMHRHKTRHIILFSLTLLLALGSIGVYSYFFSQVRSKNESASLMNQDVEIALSRQDQIQELKKTLARTEIERQSIDSHFVENDNPTIFLESLEYLGKQSGTMFTLSSVLEVKEKDKPSRLEAGFKASGSFAQIYKLILLIENMPYEVEFKNVSLNAGISQTESLWEINGIINLISFINTN